MRKNKDHGTYFAGRRNSGPRRARGRSKRLQVRHVGGTACRPGWSGVSRYGIRVRRSSDVQARIPCLKQAHDLNLKGSTVSGNGSSHVLAYCDGTRLDSSSEVKVLNRDLDCRGLQYVQDRTEKTE